ncbi:unnamed protein product [Paramecium sonneborni]|uniref:Uncharacterized protein n=1 Tax=Paramecium sonneborni TaxID=65129 RepID=A0A8S1MQ26_9CILI|nr:unnamed protein product [Paramecium sonneborni]
MRKQISKNSTKQSKQSNKNNINKKFNISNLEYQNFKNQIMGLKENDCIMRKEIKDLERRIQKKLSKIQLKLEEVQKEKKKIKMKGKLKFFWFAKRQEIQLSIVEKYSTNDEIICYNYGSQKHTLKDCQKPKSGSLKFATFFVSSHISRDNPKNSKGLYVYGLDANMQQYSLHSSQLRFKSQEQNHLKIIITTKRRLHE